MNGTTPKIVNEHHRRIFLDGWDAFLTSKSEGDNPFSFGNHLERDRARTWALGWNSCKRSEDLPDWAKEVQQ